MPGLDTTLVTHKLNVNANNHPVKQAPLVFRHKLELQIKGEVEKLLQAGFIRPIKHPIWPANIVPVAKSEFVSTFET